jgi:hypothetical protein
MKRILLFLISLCILNIANAQAPKTTIATKRVLKKVMEIAIPEGTGSNGGSVVFHPVSKKYYIPMLGNAGYPFSIFDTKGKVLSTKEAGSDLRGLWYNPITKNIEGNCYNEGGWVKYKLDAKGEINEPEVFIDGAKQPEEQSVGVFNATEKVVYFLYDSGVAVYNMIGEEKKKIVLKKSKSDTAAILFDDDCQIYNTTALIYTGIPKAEIGIFNIEDKKIELYNKATGIYATEWKLPEDCSNYPMFNFAYANNMVWLFDKENRKWITYK